LKICGFENLKIIDMDPSDFGHPKLSRTGRSKKAEVDDAVQGISSPNFRYFKF